MLQGFRSRLFRILRVALLVLALIAGAQWLRRTLTSVDSEQAVINAEIVQIRTPIAGELEIGEVRPGMLLHKGDVLFTVKNPRFADRGESVTQYNGLQNLVEYQKSELLGAKQSLEAAGLTRARAQRLYKSQLIARNQAEDEDARYQMAQKLVSSKADQLARSEKRALEMKEQMEMARESAVHMPVDGVVWSVVGKAGEQFDANKPVLEVINPAHIWVDAFFPERFAQQLKPGLPAVVRSLDSTTSWAGYLRSVRAGVGRMAFDTTVAVPPPESAKRQIAARVEAEWLQPFSAVEFYGVGRSVQVSFQREKNERTVGDALREKWDHALSGSRGATASTEQ